MASKHTGSPEQRREAMPAAIACAAAVLSIFERVASDDSRPRDALEGAERWLRGEIGVGQARALAIAAHAAAREVPDDAARAAARAAGHAAATAHMVAHAQHAETYANKALRSNTHR